MVFGLFIAILAVPAWAADTQPEASWDNFFGRISDGVLSSDSYTKAPETPMDLRLHRPETFGVHLHNVEFRISSQPGLDVPLGKNNTQFVTPTSELEFSGFILPRLLFAQVVIEPRDSLGRGLGDSLAKNISATNAPSGIVRDAFFDLIVDQPGALARVGQQRIPFGIEPQTPGGLLPFINRAYMDLKMTHNAGRYTTAFADAELIQERDIGVQARGKLGYFNYAGGVFNGSGINVSDTNSNKDFIGRLGVAVNQGIRFGISGYNGLQTNIQSVNMVRNRAGVDFEVLPSVIPRFRFMAEAVSGKDGPIQRTSWYTSGFYDVITQKNSVSPKVQIALRYDEMKDDDRFRRTTLGINYYILDGVNANTGYWQQVKLQLNYEWRYHLAGLSTDAFARDLVMGQLTVRY